MKKIIKQTWILGLVAFVLTSILPSCKKQINMAPENATYDEVFWVDGRNVNKALTGAYSMLRDAFRVDRSYFIFGDLAANNFQPGSDYWNYMDMLQARNFNFNYVPYLEGSLKNWSRFYAIVNQCHLIIENAPNIPDSKYTGGAAQKKRLLGEAKFLRAYVYFYMQRVWGDVILTKETVKDPTNVAPLPRSPESETMNYCLADLQSASALLDNDANKTHANKVSALALLAQVYAWKKDYVNSEKYCDSVINNSPVSLEDLADYRNIWEGNSKESILELSMKFDAVSNEATSGFFNAFLNNDYITNRNFPASGWALSQTSLGIFGLLGTNIPPDARRDMVIEPAGNGLYMLSKYTGVDYYDPNNKNTYVVSNNLVLIRLADTYLLRAEARVKNGNQTGALQDLNVITARAGSTEVKGLISLNAIADERLREFIGEGSNQFDFIRMEQLPRYFPIYTPERIAKKGYFWPLDMRTLLKQDELLTQNEWWNNN
ncbi:RagB/SusD family nutrient uptake outer membrane protein [Pedobacter frigoris]|uniref:RagB/SusD family nutrient uptake outer membrane protein n=1 Tax=Pedobacter frigoris TaxID=2571272 RepID=UPI00292FE814|nr:RagB/SusD family nutrient uptake outer membrane protein [Pedobacter frigoris]